MKNCEANIAKKRTLVWAIDPRQKEISPSAASVSTLAGMAKRMGLRISPVCILSSFSAERDRAQFRDVHDAQAQLNAFVQSFPEIAESEPKVLFTEGTGQEAAVRKLIQFSMGVDAAAIAVSSHGWSGMDRLFLGSFAETALRLAPLPVFFLNRELAATGDSIFFPTDFSRDSSSCFHRLLKTLTWVETKIVIFHAVTYPLPTDLGLGVFLPDNFLLEQEAWARAKAARWIKVAKKMGVAATSVVRLGGVGSVTGEDLIAAAAEFNAGVLVLLTKSSGVGRTLFGSIAFPVFRANQCLAMVYGPHAIA